MVRKLMWSPYWSAPVATCFDGDGDGSGDGTGDGTGAGDPGNAAPKTFTQEELNKFLAEDKRKHQAQYQKIEKQYQDLLQKTNLSTEERSKLEESLEDVRKQLRSREEQAKYEKKQLEDTYSQRLAEAEAKAKKTEERYYDMLITRAIQDAAVAGDAFQPKQIVTLLKQHVKLVDDKPMIEFPDFDTETGEQIVTQRTPDEAITRMKQLPEVWGNLFKSNVVSGVGGTSNTGMAPGANGQVDVRKLSTEQYMKLRKENPAALGLKPKK